MALTPPRGAEAFPRSTKEEKSCTPPPLMVGSCGHHRARVSNGDAVGAPDCEALPVVDADAPEGDAEGRAEREAEELPEPVPAGLPEAVAEGSAGDGVGDADAQHDAEGEPEAVGD